MRFNVRNLGPIVRADVEIGSLTMICGKNNNGKTYLSYTLDTFLDTIDRNLELPLHKPDFDILMSSGEVAVDLMDYIQDYIAVVNETVPRFTQTLPRFLAMHPDRFSNTEIVVELTEEEIKKKFADEATHEPIDLCSDVMITDSSSLRFEKSSSSTRVVITLLNKADKLPAVNAVSRAAAFSLAHMFDDSPVYRIFPKTFIITCERTGAALFRSEFIPLRNDGKNEGSSCTARKRIMYQRPVEKDLEFVLDLKNVVLKKSDVAINRPDLIEQFCSIAGGKYIVDKDTDQVRFQPDGSRTMLSLAESSSTVRSLAELYFYLAHKAKFGQILMFDEPELNLHPENQRKLARLLVKLVNAGLKVFITTHSDYIVREINALIVINSLPDHARGKILEEFSYSADELLATEKVRSYILNDGNLDRINPQGNGAYSFSSFDTTLSDYADLFTAIMTASTDDQNNEGRNDVRMS